MAKTKKRPKAAAEDSGSLAASFKYEVILWAVLALSIILFISNFGIAGIVGDFISSILFGLFGFSAYIFPVLLFAGTAFIISNMENRIAMVKAAAAAVFFLFACMFLELVGGDSQAKTPFDSYLWAASNKFGGGLIGGLLTWLIRPHLGTISAYIIDIAMLIICMVLITQRSLWKHVQSGGRKMYVSAKNETIRQHQQYNERRQRRIDNKVMGVSTDTSIKDTVKKGSLDGISELHPDPAFAQDFPIHMMGKLQPGRQDQNLTQQAAAGSMGQYAGPQASPVCPDTVLFPNYIQDMMPEKEPDAQVSMDGLYPGTLPRTDGEDIQNPGIEPDLFDNVIPIKNKKIALQPNTPETQTDLGQIDAASTGIEENAALSSPVQASDIQDMEKEEEDDILSITSGLFSDLMPGIDDEAQEEPDTAIQEFIPTENPEVAHIDTASLTSEVPDLPEAIPAAGSVFTDTTAKKQDVPTAAQPPAHNPKQSKAEIDAGVTGIGMQLQQAKPAIKREYILPPVSLLKEGDPDKTGDSRQHLQETALKLQQTLKNFGVNVTILNVSCGPSVTRYEIQPEMGVKVSKIVNLADDIKLNLAAADIRIEAPIPGKAAIGIEVPNKENVPVMFRDLIESEEFQKQASPCAFAAGKDIAGQIVVTDICKMPHLLIAGATGSGKSVCINTIIMSILYKADPDDVKLIMVDPKVVELSVYNGIPHLLLPVVTDPKKAAGALHWAVSEMMDRYQKFADYGVRDMKGYNAKIKKIADIPDESKPQKMPYIVIIVDELADLMMAAPGDVEDAICRLAQLARAAGIHLIIATQRPSVNVITGLIKANMPSRIAFSVTSGIDSRTILDMNGAEKLLGKGDMLFYPQGYQKPVRVQGAFVSDSEVSEVVEFLTSQNGPSSYSSDIEEQVSNAASGTGGAPDGASQADERDVYFADAARLLIDKDKASVSMLQRYFKIGFNRAARIIDQLEEAGVVGPEEGTKPRKILMGPEEFAQYEEEVL